MKRSYLPYKWLAVQAVRSLVWCGVFLMGGLVVAGAHTLPHQTDTVYQGEVVSPYDPTYIQYLLPMPPNFEGFAEMQRSYDLQPLREGEDKSWHFYILVFLVVFLAYIRINFTKELSDVFRAMFNLTLAQQLHREQELSIPLSAVLMNALFVLCSGYFFFWVGSYFDLKFSGFVLLLFCVLSMALLTLLKFYGLKIIAFIFPFGPELDFYNFNVFLINKVLGILLIPFLIFMALATEKVALIVAYAAVGFVLLLLLYAYLRGIMIAKDYLVHRKFHFFVYLCSLEIAPLLLLTEIVSRWIVV